MATTEPGTRHLPPRRPRFSMAWFAGTDLRVLEQTPNERRFYGTLGFAVAALCSLGGLSFALAAGYWLGKPAGDLWWAGVGWALLMMCGIEPLVLQMTSARRRYLPLVLLPRVALSLLLAIQIGEPLVLRINQDDIDARLAATHAAEMRDAEQRTDSFYRPRIDAARDRIREIRDREDGLRRRARENAFRSSCEAGTPSCSTTGRVGCGAYCQYYHQQAVDAANRLRSIEGPNRARIADLQAEIETLTRRAEEAKEEQLAAIGRNSGLPARERALAALQAESAAVMAQTWFLRLLFLALDLTPLAAKLVRMLSDSPYEEMARAYRAEDSAEAHARAERARVRVHEATVQAEAQRTVASEQARAWAIGRVNRIWARFRGPTIGRDDWSDASRDDEQRPAA